MPSVKKFTQWTAHPFREIANKTPLLSEQEEIDAFERGDTELLFRSHLRLVLRIGRGYKGYGHDMHDIYSEGAVGLTKAIERFKPDKGARLGTYAGWWIRAAIQEFVLANARLVKMGTTAAQKKLFFHSGEIHKGTAAEVAERLNVPVADVESMRMRLQSDCSLNAPMPGSKQGVEDVEWIEFLEDESPNQESVFEDEQERGERSAQLQKALSVLNERERFILLARMAQENPPTLEELSLTYGISRERIRQIEQTALRKMREFLTDKGPRPRFPLPQRPHSGGRPRGYRQPKKEAA